MQDDLRLELAGGAGPGAGKHVVLVAGDEEYRSEEALPMLAGLLSERHGFRCTVLFATDPASGTIDPTVTNHQPGLAQLDSADMLVLFTRFREWPDADMAHFVRYVESGRPILGIRTATHAFQYERDPKSTYAHWDWRSTTWPGGFGRQVLGETWISHHGAHGTQSTRGVIEPALAAHPVLHGVRDLWGPTDVYGIRDLPADARVLVRGQVLEGMQPDSPPAAGALNEPTLPVVWLRERELEGGKTQRVVCSTLGASVDLKCEDLRRLFVNAVFWGVGLDVPERAEAAVVGPWAPTPFGFGAHVKGLRARDLRSAAKTARD
ncbi:MAG: hypothetical protein ACKVWV_14555 [Planctomycetota bacterium]